MKTIFGSPKQVVLFAHFGAIAAIFALIILFSPPAGAATWTINDAGTGDFPTIQAAVNEAADGDLIYLEPGSYSGPGNWDVELLNRNLTIQSVDLNYGATEINCNDGSNHHRGFYVSGGSPAIEGLTIRAGLHDYGAGAYIDAGSPSFYYCFFDSCTALDYGGGLVVRPSSSPQFDYCWFYHNHSDGEGGAAVLNNDIGSTFSNCTFWRNHSETEGGAIFAAGTDAEFTDCNFTLNSAASEGGAVRCHYSASPSFDDCTFSFNNTQLGGAISCTYSTTFTAQNCLFHNNSAIRGGALLCEGQSTPTLTNCSLIRNIGTYASGIYCQSLGAPIFENSLIAWGLGPAFDHYGDGGISFDCCGIFGNQGGDWRNGIEGQEGTHGNFSEDPRVCNIFHYDFTLAQGSPCLSENNPSCGQIGAYGQGCDYPAYFVNDAGTGMLATLQDAIDLAPSGSTIYALGTFTGPGNRDLDFGGKDLIIDGDGTGIIDCGGSDHDPHRAFYFHLGETSASRLENLTIRNGYDPAWGGAILMEYGSSPTIHNCTFENCTAETSGGAIHIDGEYGFVSCAIDSCHFEDNWAHREAFPLARGGAIRALFASLTLVGCDFLNNTTTYFAGAVDVQFCSTLVVQDCLFSSNQVLPDGSTSVAGAMAIQDTETDISDCTFEGNSARSAGGIHIFNTGGQLAEFANCLFDGNIGIDNIAGALRTQGAGTTRLTECIFQFNHSARGGALSSTSEMQIQGYSLYFEQNTATESGGAVFQGINSGSLFLEDCTFDSNGVTETGGEGGVVYLSGDAYLVGSTIEWGSIPGDGYGAGIYADAGSTVGLEICTLKSNSCRHGGGIYATQSTLTVDSCEFLSNSATLGAAAYLIEDAGSYFTFCDIYENTASGDCGGILCETASSPTIQNCSFVSNGSGYSGAHLDCRSESYPEIYNSILAFSQEGAAVGIDENGGEPYFICTDIYGNAGGDWIGDIAYQLSDDGNFTEDPLFCDLSSDDLTLYNTSPCMPANSPCGQLVGAHHQGCTDITGVPELALSGQPLGFNLNNPFTPGMSRLAFTLPEAAGVELAVYDAMGRRVRDLIKSQTFPAGYHKTGWDGLDESGLQAGSGIYFFNLVAGDEQVTRKGILLR